MNTLLLCTMMTNAYRVQDVSYSVKNFSDLQLAVTVFVGSESEPHSLVLDTGSYWTWI